MGDTKEKQRQTQTRSPYSPATGMIDQSISGAQDWLSNPASSAAYDYTPSDMTTQGIGKLGAAAGANASSGYLTNVLNGSYLNAGNPYQSDLDAGIRASVAPSINATFSNAGMAGSTMHQGMLMKGLTQALAAPRYQNYQAERANQQAAAGLLPQVDAQAAQQAITAGQMKEGYDKAQWDENRTAGLRPYLETQGLLGTYGNMGGTSTGSSTTSAKTPLGEQILGGVMGIGGLMSGNPLGMIGQGIGGQNWGYNAPAGTLPWQKNYSLINALNSGN